MAVIGIMSCGKKEIYIKAYYFPYTQFANSSTYKYVDTNDSSKVFYWNFSSTIKNADTIFATMVYNKQLVLNSVFINYINQDGVELREMYVNTSDSIKLRQCEIKSGQVFSWKLKPKESLFVSYSIVDSITGQTEEIVSERLFQPQQESATYLGKGYNCLIVQEKTLINHIVETRTKTEEQERKSYFAPGIGLIRFETLYIDGTTSIFSLQKVLTKKEWEELVKSSEQKNITIQ